MTGASENTGEIEAFFARYARAFAARDGQALAQCFLYPCHIVGDDGEITLTVVTSVEHYLDQIIKPLFKVYRRLGVGQWTHTQSSNSSSLSTTTPRDRSMGCPQRAGRR